MADNFLENHYEDYLVRKAKYSKKNASPKKAQEGLEKIRKKMEKERVSKLRWED